MPQLLPYTLELQFNTIVLLFALIIVLVSCYLLPTVVKQLVSRVHLSI